MKTFLIEQKSLTLVQIHLFRLLIIVLIALVHIGCNDVGGNATAIATATGSSTATSSGSGDSGGGGGGCASTAPSSVTASCSLGCPATEAFVFPTTATTDGAIGGSDTLARLNADSMCVTERNMRGGTLTCKRVKALISISGSDTMAGLPTTCGGNIQNSTAIYQGGFPSTLVAASWTGGASGFLDNNWAGQIEDPGWTNVWTGSYNDGTIVGGGNCSSFTDNLTLGAFSNVLASGTTGILNAGNIACSQTYSLLCICF